MFHIKINNFQSLTDADICLEDGLTIVTGATNNGKSAIVRAIGAAVFNDGTDDQIKAGSDGLSVLLDNGEHKALYMRKAKGRTDKTTYQFDDGDVQQKVGRNQLPEMVKLFNIGEVRLQNNQKAQLNFWQQNEYPFLMDKTAGQLYEFLAVSSSEKYLAVLKEMNTDMKQEEADIKTLTTSIDTLKKEISVKQDILDCNRDFPAVYDAISALKEEEDKLARASSLLSEMDGIRQLSNTIGETLRRVVSEIEQVPMEQVTNKMKQFIALADSTERVYKIFSDTSRVESRLSLVKEKADKATRDSVKSSQLLQGFQKKIDSLIKQEAMVSSIDVAESVFKEAQKKVWDCHKQASALPSNLLSFEKQVLLQKQVAAVEQGETWLSERRKATIEVMNAASGMKRSREALATVIARLNESDKELEFLKQQLGICPFCGASFDTSCAHSI